MRTAGWLTTEAICLRGSSNEHQADQQTEAKLGVKTGQGLFEDVRMLAQVVSIRFSVRPPTEAFLEAQCGVRHTESMHTAALRSRGTI